MNWKTAIITIAAALAVPSAYFAFRAYRIAHTPVVLPTIGTVTASVYASGKTKSDRVAELSFVQTGRITSIAAKKNHDVRKGDLLASIDTSDIVANRNKELADYMKTRWDHDQVKDEYRTPGQGYWGLTPEARNRLDRDLEKAQFDLSKSVTNVEIADRAIRNAALYAPFDGIVTDVTGEVNEWTTAFSTEPLITVIDPRSIYFEAEIDEDDIGKVIPGQTAMVTFDAYPDRPYRCTITDLDRRVIEKSNEDTVLPIRMEFAPGELPPLTGLSGDAKIDVAVREGVMTVPRQSVRKEGTRNVVDVLRNGEIVRIPVTTGLSDTRSVEIIGGLGPDEPVVLQPGAK